VLDIAVDIRVGSPNFGKWVSVVLSGENHAQLYIPKGFAHGFVVRSETADFLYKCSDYYDGPDDRGVLWNDPGPRDQLGNGEAARLRERPALPPLWPRSQPISCRGTSREPTAHYADQ
jgi:dTDP-4-dehydrorhamnose 3,5-epimerase-like enzyme